MLAEIHVRSWQATYRGSVPDGYLRALDPVRWRPFWQDRLRRAEARTGTLVVVPAGTDRPIGFVSFGPSRDPDHEPESGTDPGSGTEPGSGTGSDPALRYGTGQGSGAGPDLDLDAGKRSGTGPGPDVGEIYAIYLLPQHWGGGAGRALMAAALAALTDTGFTRATLWVLAGNDRARRFYARGGWHPDGLTKRDESRGFPLDEMRYPRDLP